MEDLINQAYKALSGDNFQEFNKAAEDRNIGTCIRIARNNLDEALEALKENAIQDQCDPIVTNHYRDSNNLILSLRKFIEDDSRS